MKEVLRDILATDRAVSIELVTDFCVNNSTCFRDSFVRKGRINHRILSCGVNELPGVKW